MSIPTPPLARDTSSGLPPQLSRILDRIRDKDFTGLPAEAATATDPELLVMLSDQELKRDRETDVVKALVSQVAAWRTNCETARLPYEQIWMKSIDMYEGRQFTRYDPNQRMMREQVLPDGRVRIAMNVCQPTMRTEMAKTTSSRPMASVQPASNDDSDILAARAAEGAWDWFYSEEKIQSRVMNLANYWRATTGNGFTKVFFDMSSEDVAANAAATREWLRDKEANAAGVAGLDAPLLANPKPTPIFGKVTATAVSPFHLYFPDLAEPDIQKQPYVIQLAYIPKERAKLIYGGSMPEDWEPRTVDATEIFQINAPGGMANQSTIDLVRVTEVWIKPNVSRYLPEGGLVVLVDDQLVGMSKDGMPYEHGDFPYQHIYTVETGRFYRMSVLEAIIPLQNELNRIFAQLIEYKNLATAPMFYYRQGSIDVNRIRTKPGTYIPVQFGSEFPQAVPLPQLPSYVNDLINAIKSALEDISGQHQVSRAISPGADTAASAISILREADDDYLSNTINSIETATELMARQALTLMVQFWKTPRLIKVAGAGEAISAKMLTSSEIASGTDIRVTVGTGLPQSRSARMAIVTEWMDKGHIPPQVGLKAIEAGTLGDLFKLLQVDEDQAARENVEMTELITEDEYNKWLADQAPAMPEDPFGAGMPPMDGGIGAAEPPMPAEPALDPMTGQPVPPPIFYPINDFDNHPVHIEVIERAMKSQQWKSLPEWRRTIMTEHRAAHVQAVADFMLRQQAQQTAMASSIDNAQMGASNEYAGGEPAAPAAPTQ
jgi:hypothetical protein